MTVVEADGNYVEEVELGNLNIYSGETYSVLVKAHEVAPEGQTSFWVVSHVRGRLPKTPPGLAILTYAQNGNADDLSKPTLPITSPPLSPAAWNDTSFSVAQSRLFVARKGIHSPPLGYVCVFICSAFPYVAEKLEPFEHSSHRNLQ
jgi:hypothetical protein